MRRLLLGVGVVLAALYLWNASWLAPGPTGDGPRLIAHRGVHQTFAREGLENDTCTAARISPPVHDFLENTISSMEAAFAAGADVVELDVHPTTDGQFAVFHDWRLECRTNGDGETRAHSMAHLRRLDIGHGYTPDGGDTFPFRGKGIGLMPSLADVLVALPKRSLLIDFKSNDTSEADLLATLLRRNTEWQGSIWGVSGGEAPAERAAELVKDARTITREATTACLTRYVALGWLDYIPEACRDMVLVVPINVAPWLWGWPNRFMVRMRDAGTQIILAGPYQRGEAGMAGIDTIDMLQKVPVGFDGYLWTNRIELIGPALRRGGPRP